MKALELSFSEALSRASTWVIFSLLNSFKWCQFLGNTEKHTEVFTFEMVAALLPDADSERSVKASDAEDDGPECPYMQKKFTFLPAGSCKVNKGFMYKIWQLLVCKPWPLSLTIYWLFNIGQADTYHQFHNFFIRNVLVAFFVWLVVFLFACF